MAERVDRRAADDGRAAGVLVDDGELPEVDGDDQHDGGRLDVVEQRVGLTLGPGGVEVGARRLDHAERRLAEADLGRVLAPDGHQIGELAAHRPVRDDDDVPSLAVRSARCETSIVEDLDDGCIRNNILGEVADGPRSCA